MAKPSEKKNSHEVTSERSKANQSKTAAKQNTKAQPSGKENRHEVTSERSKANRSKTAARSQNQQDRPLFFCVKKSGGL
jgi:hypothetical protein